MATTIYKIDNPLPFFFVSCHFLLRVGQVLDLLKKADHTRVELHNSSISKWFRFDYYVANGLPTVKRHRVTFDDPSTLRPKYEAVLADGVAGIGAWTVDATHRISKGATKTASLSMWATVRESMPNVTMGN